MIQELKVHLSNIFVGTLSKSESDQYIFKYDQNYLMQDFCKQISITLPLREEPFESNKLHSFFDNLASEGWLGERQAKTIKTNQHDKFKLLKYYGNDLIGGVHIKYEENCVTNIAFDLLVSFKDDDHSSNSSQGSVISINSDSTISGVQKKLLVFQTTQGEYKIVSTSDLSTHIAKCSSDEFSDLIELEYLSTLAFRNLLPDDTVCEMDIIHLNEINENVLLIKRFDRIHPLKRKHFEEFNQLLNLCTNEKYDLSYDSMAKFMYENKERCDRSQIVKLFKRILACFLIGNTDAHLKNFAMFHEDNYKLALTPAYDLVGSSYYKEFQQIALEINGNKRLEIKNLKPKHIVDFGMNTNGFNLDKSEILTIVNYLEMNLNFALNEIKNCNYGSNNLKNKICDMIQKRWNGSFNGIGNYLKNKK
jgi:serine/threonine-protein kinase HipA